MMQTSKKATLRNRRRRNPRPRTIPGICWPRSMEQENQALRERNRIAWNRYFAANLDEETRARLIYEKRHPAEELTLFSSDDLQEVERAFVKRKGSAREMSFPAGGSEIDFSNVQFDKDITFDKYLFPKSFFLTPPSPVGPCSTKRLSLATLISAGRAFQAWFWDTTFSEDARFENATFSLGADSQAPPFPAWLFLTTPASPAWLFRKRHLLWLEPIPRSDVRRFKLVH
jgi:hypothetical protein